LITFTRRRPAQVVASQSLSEAEKNRLQSLLSSDTDQRFGP